MRETKVVSAEDPKAQRYLWNFESESTLVRVKGEGRFASTVFPEFSPKTKNVLLEFIPSNEFHRPSSIIRWFRALRLPYFGISFFPVALVALLSFQKVGPNFLLEAILFLLSLFFVHSACVFWGEAEDHLRGVDLPSSQTGSGVIRSLWISAKILRRSAAGTLIMGIVSGLGLLLLLPLQDLYRPLIFLGMLGVFGAASYSGWPFHYKYLGLGEPLVFFLSGPLLAMVSSLVFLKSSADFLHHSLVVFPLAMTTVNLLHVGNIQRIPFDNMAHVSTIASRLGFDRAKALLCMSLFFPFLLQLILAVGKLAPIASCTCILALPYAIFLLRKIKAWKGPLDPRCLDGKRDLFLFQIVFGSLLLLGIFISGKVLL